MLAPSHRKFISPEINLENSCKFYKVRVEANNCIDPYRYLAPALSRQHLSPSVWSVRTQQSPLQAAKGQSTPVRGAGWAEICSPTQGTGRNQCRLTKQTLQEASKHTDEKMTFAHGKQDVCGCLLSLHLSMSPCNKCLLHQNSCTQQETTLEMQGLPKHRSEAALTCWVLCLF